MYIFLLVILLLVIKHSERVVFILLLLEFFTLFNLVLVVSTHVLGLMENFGLIYLFLRCVALGARVGLGLLVNLMRVASDERTVKL